MSNLKIYCQSCGAAHAYTMQKPKFCQSCGEAFSSAVAKTTSSPVSLEIEEFKTIRMRFYRLHTTSADVGFYNGSKSSELKPDKTNDTR